MEALAVGHHQRGHDVSVVALLLGQHTTDPLIPALRDQGVAVFEKHVGARSYLKERRYVRGVCRSFRPHIVHTHGYRTDVVDGSVATGMGIPTVTTVHGPSMNGGLRGALYEWAQRANYRRFDAVVAVSTALYETSLADGVSADRLHLIPNAWANLHPALPRSEARQELDLANDEPVVGWVGRMLHVKGGDIFLEAINRLEEPRPTVVMIGQGEEGASLRAQAEQLGLGETVRFYDDITEAGRLFGAFDAYVLSSRSEGLPIVLLEAMAAGTPIIATRVGGVQEAVGEEEALLVDPGDPDHLARAIRETLRDRNSATARSKKAVHRLETDFAIEPWLDRYEDVYRRAMQAE